MEVKFYSSALKYTGGTVSVAIEPECCPDLNTLLNLLGTRYSEEFKNLLQKGEKWLLLVNSKAVMTTGGLSTQLKSGDTIEVLPLIGAG